MWIIQRLKLKLEFLINQCADPGARAETRGFSDMSAELITL